MEVWLKVHRENVERRLLEALAEFLQSKALEASKPAEVAEVFRAVEETAGEGEIQRVEDPRLASLKWGRLGFWLYYLILWYIYRSCPFIISFVRRDRGLGREVRSRTSGRHHGDIDKHAERAG